MKGCTMNATQRAIARRAKARRLADAWSAPKWLSRLRRVTWDQVEDAIAAHPKCAIRNRGQISEKTGRPKYEQYWHRVFNPMVNGFGRALTKNEYKADSPVVFRARNGFEKAHDKSDLHHGETLYRPTVWELKVRRMDYMALEAIPSPASDAPKVKREWSSDIVWG